MLGMVKDTNDTLLVTSIEGYFKMVRLMDEEFMNGEMERSMMVIGTME